MRLIDADALKEFIGKVRAEYNFFTDEERPRYEAHSKALELLNIYLNDAPSIDIVFCKDCKLGGTEDCPMDEIDDEYFCNFGEREGE